MLTEQEYEQLKTKAWAGTLTGFASKRWEYAKYFLLENPNSDYKHYRMGVALLKQAAMQGNAFAQGDLAYLLYYGKGIDKDVKKALEWCNKALDKWRSPQMMRLREVITKPKNIMLSNAQMALYRAILHHDVSYIEPRIDENVILSDLMRYPTPGKKDVMEWLEEGVSRRELQPSLVSTERFGMVTETYIPGNKRTIVRSLYFIRTNEENKIDRIARQPIVWSEYCFDAGSTPFSWEEIEPCLNDVDTKFNRGFMFCMNCGKLSHELKWIRFHSNPDLHGGYSYIGRMSVCPDCQQQVEFHCENCKKLKY